MPGSGRIACEDMVSPGAIFIAAAAGSYEDVEQLLEASVKHDMQDTNRYTPLHYAHLSAKYGRTEAVRLLPKISFTGGQSPSQRQMTQSPMPTRLEVVFQEFVSKLEVRLSSVHPGN